MLFFALIDDLLINKPKFFIFENVKGLLTHDRGMTLQNVKQAITDAGYRLSYSVLNAEDYLCPQSRQRLFLVGVRDDLHKTFEFPTIKFGKVGVREVIDDLIGNVEKPNNEPMKHSQRIVERHKFIPKVGLKRCTDEHQQRKRGNASVVGNQHKLP